MDKSDTVLLMTDRYLERYGKALIGVYYLPPMTENWKFPVFMNSLLVTLRRLDLMPGYIWFMDASEGHYLILWLNGYFRNDLSDITPAVHRLWQIHSALPINIIDCFMISSEAPEYGKRLLSQFLYSHGLSHPITANWHQRTFGTSRLR